VPFGSRYILLLIRILAYLDKLFAESFLHYLVCCWLKYTSLRIFAQYIHTPLCHRSANDNEKIVPP